MPSHATEDLVCSHCPPHLCSPAPPPSPPATYPAAYSLVGQPFPHQPTLVAQQPQQAQQLQQREGTANRARTPLCPHISDKHSSGCAYLSPFYCKLHTICVADKQNTCCWGLKRLMILKFLIYRIIVQAFSGFLKKLYIVSVYLLALKLYKTIIKYRDMFKKFRPDKSFLLRLRMFSMMLQF